MSRVRPGVLLTNARRRPASVFSALDLPALERPAKAISPSLCGRSARSATLLKKVAREKTSVRAGMRPDMAWKCLNLLEYQLFPTALPTEYERNDAHAPDDASDRRDLVLRASRRRAGNDQARRREGPDDRLARVRRVPRA